MKRWTVTLAALLRVAEVASAQEMPIALDFEEVLDLAFSTDPGLGARDDAISVEEYRVKEAIADYFPRVDAYSSYTRSSQQSGIEIFNPLSTSTERIEFFPENRYDFGLLLTQEIYTFGRRPARKRAAEKGLFLQLLEKEDYQQKLYDRTARAFATVLFHGKNMEIQSENRKRAEAKLAIVKARVSEGLATGYDLIRTELLLARYDGDHNRAAGDFQRAKANLKDLMAWDRDQDFVPVGELAELEAPVQDTSERASDKRIEIRKLLLQYEALREEARINRSRFFPDLKCSAGYDWRNGYQPDLSRIEGAWSIGLSLNWRLIDGGGRRSRLRQARLQAEMTQKLAADVRLSIRAEWEAADADLASVATDLRLARRTLDLADRGLEIAQEQYRQGILGIADLLDLELERGAALAALNLAEYNLIMARLDYKKAVGFYPESF